MRTLFNDKDPPERATAPVGSLNEAAFPASFTSENTHDRPREQAAILPFPSPAVVAVRMDRRNGQFQVVELVPGEGGYRPGLAFLDAAAAVRHGIERARQTGSRFRGVVR